MFVDQEGGVLGTVHYDYVLFEVTVLDGDCRSALAFGGEAVLVFAAHAVAFGHLLGGGAHRIISEGIAHQ